jgi:hypothetical protein
MPLKIQEAKRVCAEDVVPFSDDFAGGYYVFPIKDGEVMESVCYWNTDGGLVPTPFKNVFEYVARFAYSAA